MHAPELACPQMDLLDRRLELETGLHFGPARRRELAAGLRRIAGDVGLAGAEDAVRWLLAGAWDAQRAELCARHLTVGETYFFREPRALELLCDYARRKAATGAPLRFWSAGCCTGEEPYSMAIALRAALPNLDPAQVSILATDLNEDSLAFARAAVYREWSFRRTPPAVRSAWFAAAGAGRHALRPEIRSQVRFARLNLATDAYPSPQSATQAMDVIFCRNVLMYFSRRQMKLAIARLRESLVEGGWLVVNPSEASGELFEGFKAIYHPDAIFYQKVSQPPAAARVVCRPLPAAAPARVPARLRPAPVTPKAAQVRPHDAQAALLRAAELARSGERQAALQVLLRATNSQPLAAELYQAAAQLALEDGDVAAAQRHLKRQLYLEPGSILGHYLSGVAQMEAGRRPAAVRHFEAGAALLAGLADDAPVPGADGWRVAGLRAALRAWMGRSA